MEAVASIADHARSLGERYRGLEGDALLRPLIEREFRGRIVVLSSFGAESALLLHMVAGIDRATPVIFIDTGKLFGETLRYRDLLVKRLGLTDLRVIGPDPGEVARRDPTGTLWHSNADGCCALRKVEPLERALNGFAAVISGRKRYQGGGRAALAPSELVERRVQIDPLAGYSRERIEQEFHARDLPPHPLEADGFLSIGCMPCTDRVAPDEDRRAGRWRGVGKTECGIHTYRDAGSGI
jgi:phosphoadenosine phosphosulfate reductase